MIVLLTFAALVGAALIYVLFLRPALERCGLVRRLPDKVATWRDRIADAVRHSATIAWGWLCVFFGTAWGLVQQAADVLGDPEIKTQVMALIPPEWVWLVVIAFGVVTIVARLRTARRME
ncbi:MAG TPA: hypothetical protein VFQ27_14870 [Xanthobacteraceae bacterium]|nr:hypothetical protein [Xanthobacteraceae bacterium]